MNDQINEEEYNKYLDDIEQLNLRRERDYEEKQRSGERLKKKEI